MIARLSPGRFRPGLLFLLLTITVALAAAGCAVHRGRAVTSAPSNLTPHRTEVATPKTEDKHEEANSDKTVETHNEEPATEQQSTAKDEEPKPVEVTVHQPQITNEADSQVSPPTIDAPDQNEHPEPPAGNLNVELKQGSRSGKMIALTFDAGASPKPTPAILAVLRRYGIHSTFFLTGKWMEANPRLTKEIVAEGNDIGNHTYSHPDLTKLDDSAVKDQLEHTEQIAQNTAGVSTKPFFRPPYGARNARVKTIAADEGYRSVFWSADSWDAFKKGITADEIRERVLSRAKGGSIVLMHCGSAPTAEALPSIIEELQARGYRLVTVSQLARSDSY